MARSEQVFAVLSPLRNIENLVDVVLLMEQMPKDMTTLDRAEVLRVYLRVCKQLTLAKHECTWFVVRPVARCTR